MLAKAKSVLIVEDLNITGLLGNRRLARRIADQGWGQFHRQLAYKTSWSGSRLVVADQWFPSGKRCSGCGFTVTELPLATRVFTCSACGLVLDRDANAARNLVWWYLCDVAASSAETRNACGGGGAGVTGNGAVKLLPVNQEPATI
jgi:putative transposase